MAHREASPRTLSRIRGVLYLIIIAVDVFGEAFVKWTSWQRRLA
jgi:hypothetical protein